jgi:hypothetical protein
MKILAALFLFSLSAQAEIIRVHGLELEARDIEYFLASDKIHRFRPAKPVAFEFAGNNFFPASDEVFLRENGTISLIVSTASEAIDWKISGSRVLPLNCGPKKNNWGNPVPRMVSFHENGEYDRGCSAAKPVEFSVPGGGIIEAQGDLDLNPDQTLAYASSLVRGSLRLKSGEVGLKPGSEIAFHENAQPHFFTMAAGQSFRAHQGEFGEILFVQNPHRPVSTGLFENGSVERGIIGQNVPFRELGISIPEGSGLVFTQKAGLPRILLAILSMKAEIEAVNNSFFASRVGLNQEMGCTKRSWPTCLPSEAPTTCSWTFQRDP